MALHDYFYNKNPSFSFQGARAVDIFIIAMFIALCLILYKERKTDMKKRKIVYKILFENRNGGVLFFYEDQCLYVCEKLHGYFVKSFEVPTLGEGINYLREKGGEAE